MRRWLPLIFLAMLLGVTPAALAQDPAGRGASEEAGPPTSAAPAPAEPKADANSGKPPEGGGSAGNSTPADASASQETKVVYEKKTVLDFSDVTLEGELTRPEGSYVLNRERARFGSLVELRGDFTPELEKSVDEF